MKSNEIVEKALSFKEVNVLHNDNEGHNKVVMSFLILEKMYYIHKYLTKEQYDTCINHISNKVVENVLNTDTFVVERNKVVFLACLEVLYDRKFLTKKQYNTCIDRINKCIQVFNNCKEVSDVLKSI